MAKWRIWKHVTVYVETLEDEIKTIKEDLVKTQGLKLKTVVLGNVKPPRFDGAVSWFVCKMRFEAAPQINNWINEENKATALWRKAAELLHTINDHWSKKLRCPGENVEIEVW